MEAQNAETLAKVTRKLVPFLFLLYIVAYLDRVNVSFAQLQMKEALGFGDAVYGLGSGIFFLGYFLFEVPSNLILERVGARRWIARIMLTWGVIAGCMVFIRSPMSFYVLRFLLGIAEAGFFPGMILYLTYWFTAADRARIVALFMTATVVSNVLGGPLSGKLLDLNGLGGLGGWQWLFLIEAAPAVLLAFVVLSYLPDGPAKARWLDPRERDWIVERLAAEQRDKAGHAHHSLGEAVRNPLVWHLAALYFTIAFTGYGIGMWLPQILKNSFKLSNGATGGYVALPYAVAAIAMVLNGRHSDRTGERRLHVAVSALVASFGLAMSALFLAGGGHGAPLALILLTFAMAASGQSGTLGPFWTIPPAFLGGAAAAGGIALINSVGNLGGFLGPYLMGRYKTGNNYTAGLLILAVFQFAGVILALLLRPARFEGRSKGVG